MVGEERAPARQVLLDRIRRPRVARRLAQAAEAPISVLVGRAGTGKSDALRELLGDAGTICFSVGNERRRFARFVHGFAQAIAPVAPGAQAAFPRAWERSLQSRSPVSALAHWVCEHLGAFDGDLVIDDLHDSAADPSVASFIAMLAELRPRAPLTIAARSVGALPVALWMATGQMQCPIDESDLSFGPDEIAAAARQAGVDLPAGGVARLLTATRGLPIAVAYALSRLRDDANAFASAVAPASFEDVAASIFARRTEREQEFLLTAALLPSFDDDALRTLGWDDPEATRNAMGADAAFIFGRDGRDRIMCHDRFLDFLEREFRTRDMTFRSVLSQRALTSLTLTGRHAAALEVATRQPMIKAMGDLLDAHGFEILESGDIDVVSEALEAVEESSLGATGLALRGYIEARSGRLDTAEAWFRLGLSRAQDEISHVTIAMYYSRELGMRRREDAWEVLASLATSTSLPLQVLIDVRSSYGRALMVANRFEEARSHTDAAIALLNADSPPALRARVFTRAARVALEIGDLEIARERALIAAPLAAAHSLYEIAASAYSTLYNIAYDIDDDAAASMNYLHRQQDMAIKSGTLRFDLFALFGSYELQAEAGDLAALAQTRGRLELVDTHDAAVELMEGMIPSEALQAAWIGNFDDARRRLAPTAERQGTAVRRSLCWAQIGLYAAAAGDGQRSAEAMLAAQSALTQLEPHETRLTQYGLTLLFLALGALTGNDIEAARRWTQLASDEAIGHARRLCALRAAIVAMIAGCEDADAFGRGVPIALAALRAESFGGMAMLIEALPYPGASPAGAPASVGGVLAGIELCARFATAVRADDASALPAWLETAPGLALGAQARIGNVRSELAAYRRPAPAAIGLIDDVDAVLDTLFEQLDVASPLMAEHSRAVSAWCSRLARTLGLSESEITFITRCGLIHDIGKVRTPPEILDAPRQLTADEWARMRAHTTEGGLIVGRLPLLTPFIAVVRGHHERLDGEGYPDALSANAIPIASRIVAVADCFNAMIGRRPYRPAMPPSQALAELKRHAGSQFDPEVVAAMVQIVDGRLV